MTITSSKTLATLLTGGLLFTLPASGFAQGAGDDQYGDPLAGGSTTLRTVKAKAGKARFTLTINVRKAATIRVSATRSGKSAGSYSFKAKRGSSSKAITRLSGKSLKKGTYRVTVRAGSSSKRVTVKVR